jgi:hypothetical protein
MVQVPAAVKVTTAVLLLIVQAPGVLAELMVKVTGFPEAPPVAAGV